MFKSRGVVKDGHFKAYCETLGFYIFVIRIVGVVLHLSSCVSMFILASLLFHSFCKYPLKIVPPGTKKNPGLSSTLFGFQQFFLPDI